MEVRDCLMALAGVALLAACSKSEAPPAPRPPANAPQAPAAPIAVPAKPGDIDEGLKERLARQEAAAKMFESKVLNPMAPKVPEPPPPAVKAATPPPAAPPRTPPATQPAQPSPPPARADSANEPAKVAARAESPRAAPAPASASPQPSATRTDLAAARPAAPRLLTRVDPDFPREAIKAGVDEGRVRARMTIDAGGNVTNVEILEASPRRVFDRAVVRALSQWRYSDGGAVRTVDMEVAFRR